MLSCGRSTRWNQEKVRPHNNIMKGGVRRAALPYLIARSMKLGALLIRVKNHLWRLLNYLRTYRRKFARLESIENTAYVFWQWPHSSNAQFYLPQRRTLTTWSERSNQFGPIGSNRTQHNFSYFVEFICTDIFNRNKGNHSLTHIQGRFNLLMKNWSEAEFTFIYLETWMLQAAFRCSLWLPK